MAAFAYKGRDTRGDLVSGVVEAGDSAAAAHTLATSGVTPIEITAARAGALQQDDTFFSGLLKERVTQKDILLFSRQMHALLKAGVPLVRALAGLQESAPKQRFKEMLERIREGLESGRGLAVALQREADVFSPFYTNMIQTGEMTGKLEEIFLELFHHLEFESYAHEQTRAALRYPSFVVAAMAVALVIVNVFVIPVFARVFASFKAKLPFMTEVVIGFSNFTVAWWPLLLILGVAAVVGFRSFVATPKGRYLWDRTKLRIPIAGKILYKAMIARLTRSLALTYHEGKPMTTALSMVSQVVDNEFIAERLRRMRTSVEAGDSLLRTAIESGIFTPSALQMIAVGEESGALDEMLREVSITYQKEVEYEVKSLSAQIEPILIIGLGVMVLILGLGVFLPMWEMGRAALH